jgi:hypothetical protein
MGKERWRHFLTAYAAQAMPDGRIPATFEVIYAHAWAGQRSQRQDNGVVSIPLEQIQRWQPSHVGNPVNHKGTSKSPMGRRSGGRGCEKQPVTH